MDKLLDRMWNPRGKIENGGIVRDFLGPHGFPKTPPFWVLGGIMSSFAFAWLLPSKPFSTMEIFFFWVSPDFSIVMNR